jgi:hypothetical protein
VEGNQTPLSYHWDVQRTHLHIKIELDHGDDEKPEKLAAEICRQLLKLYGVRSAEVSNLVTDA